MPRSLVVPLLMNGLQGRMLRVPARRANQREILVVYGQHASLEYWWPLAAELSQLGAVTMPDLPGFGGMQSFYKIGEKPTIDTFADYLAAFIKLRYKSKRLTIVGVAFGFVVVTRMLQHDPDLAKRVDIVISLGGVARYDDLAFNPAKRLGYRLGTRLLATRPLSLFVRHVCWHPVVLNAWYSRQNPPAPNATAEIALWRRNNVRTHFMTLAALFKLDNCQQAVAVPLFHLALVSNKQIDNQHTIQHLHVIFPRVDVARSRLKSKYIGTIDYHSSARLLPAKLRRLLAS